MATSQGGQTLTEALRYQLGYDDDPFKSKWQLLSHADTAASSTFSPSGDYLAVGTNSGEVHVYDIVQARTLKRTLIAPPAPADHAGASSPADFRSAARTVRAIAWSFNSRIIFAGSVGGQLTAFDIAAGHAIRSIAIGTTIRFIRPHPTSAGVLLIVPVWGAPVVLDFTTGEALQLPEEGWVPPRANRAKQSLLQGRPTRCDAVWAGAAGSEIVTYCTRGYVTRWAVQWAEQRRTTGAEGPAGLSLSVARLSYAAVPGSPPVWPEIGGAGRDARHAAVAKPGQSAQAIIPTRDKGLFVVDLASLKVIDGPFNEPVDKSALRLPSFSGARDKYVLAAPSSTKQSRYKGGLFAFRRGELGALHWRQGPPGDLQHFACHPRIGLIVCISCSGQLWVLQQPFHSMWPGPMYPAGFALMLVNRPYEEKEGEFDLVVRSEGGKSAGSGAGAGSSSAVASNSNLSNSSNGAHFTFRKAPYPDQEGFHDVWGGKSKSKGKGGGASQAGDLHGRLLPTAGAGASASTGITAPPQSPALDFSALTSLGTCLREAAARGSILPDGSPSASPVSSPGGPDDDGEAETGQDGSGARAGTSGVALPTDPALVGSLSLLVAKNGGGLVGVAAGAGHASAEAGAGAGASALPAPSPDSSAAGAGGAGADDQPSDPAAYALYAQYESMDASNPYALGFPCSGPVVFTARAVGPLLFVRVDGQGGSTAAKGAKVSSIHTAGSASTVADSQTAASPSGAGPVPLLADWAGAMGLRARGRDGLGQGQDQGSGASSSSASSSSGDSGQLDLVPASSLPPVPSELLCGPDLVALPPLASNNNAGAGVGPADQDGAQVPEYTRQLMMYVQALRAGLAGELSGVSGSGPAASSSSSASAKEEPTNPLAIVVTTPLPTTLSQAKRQLIAQCSEGYSARVAQRAARMETLKRKRDREQAIAAGLDPDAPRAGADVPVAVAAGLPSGRGRGRGRGGGRGGRRPSTGPRATSSSSSGAAASIAKGDETEDEEEEGQYATDGIYGRPHKKARRSRGAGAAEAGPEAAEPRPKAKGKGGRKPASAFGAAAGAAAGGASAAAPASTGPTAAAAADDEDADMDSFAVTS